MGSKIFYFEGPDHAGKTTLIDQIRMPGDLFWHNGVYESPQAAYDAYMDQYYDASCFLVNTFGENNVIIDRGPFAEVIYGKAVRGTDFKPSHLYNCLDRLRDINATLVVCLPPYEVAKEGWSKRLGIEYVKKEQQYKEIYDRYSRLYDVAIEAGINTILYDYTKTGEYNANSK